MSVILVVEQDADHAERIRAALRADGLVVEAVDSSVEASRRAQTQAPRLLLASSSLPRAGEILAAFSRARGGPGTIVLVPEGEASQVSAADFRADEMLATPFADEDLRQLVRRCLQPAADEDDADDEQLTSADIFGDVLAEVEAEVRRAAPAPRPRKPETPMADIERKLEETLSGVFPAAGRSKRPGAASAAETAGSHPSPDLPDDAEIDALLDKTLSSLDLPTRARKPSLARAVAAAAPPAPEAPVASEPTPPAAATEQAPAAPAPTVGIEREPVPGPEPELRFEPFPDLEPVELPGLASAEPGLDAPRSAPEEPPAGGLAGPAGATPPGPSRDSVLDEVLSPADQFRTQALPALDLLREASPGEPFGDYTLLERIAVGGMAEVWRARRRGVEGFQKAVAIKKILSHLTGSRDFVTMFIDEAKLAAQLTHNNIIQIYDLGKVGDDFFIAMELVDGKDLRSILTAAQTAGRPVPVGLGLFIVSAVARALDYAHRKRDFDHRALGLVHRDVSPQNVLISYEGAIKLCDFGIVKAVAKTSTTQMGALKGKLQYMSPEQAWGKTVDARSDIFSLGSVLFEVLTGTQLFAGESEIGVLDAVRECRVQSTRESVPEIPESVDRIVQKALAKTPEERFQTAGDMEHEIKAALDELGPAPSQKDLAAYMHSLFMLPQTGDFTPPAAFDALPAAFDALPAIATPTPDEEVAVAAAPAPDEEAALPAPAADVAPAVDAAPAGEESEAPAAEPVVEPLAEADAEIAAPKGRSLKWIVAAILVAVLIGVGLWVARSRKAAAPAASPAAQPAPAIEAPAPPPPAATGEPGAEPSSSAAPDADAEPDVAAGEAADAGAGLPATAAGIDIEQLVNEELTNRAERLRQDFEAEKKRLEDELAKTREASPPPPQDENAGDGADGR